MFILVQKCFFIPKNFEPFDYLYFFSLSVSLMQIQSKKELKIKMMLNEQRFPWKQIKALPKEKKPLSGFFQRQMKPR